MQKQPLHPLHLVGPTSAEVEASRAQFGSNVLTPPQREPWWELFLEKFNDPVIRILIIAAIIALAIGFFQGDYIEGVGILIAILLATTVAFFNEYKANQEFNILNQVNDEVPVEVLRDGNFTTVPKKDLVVGDYVVIENGQEVPADGELIEGVSLQVNEAKLTGETVPVRKRLDPSPDLDLAYPANFLLRDTIIIDGHGMIKVTAVGDQTEIGRTAQAMTVVDDIETPLNQQLERLSKLIGVLGLAIAVLIDGALIIRGIITAELALTASQWYVIALLGISGIVGLVKVWLPIIYDGLEIAGRDFTPPDWLENDTWIDWLKPFSLGGLIFAIGITIGRVAGGLSAMPTQWLSAEIATTFLTYFMIAVAVIVVAVPEGLALSVTLSLAYSMRKMSQQNNLVRRMHACETIGAATVICSDKTGTLTLNQMRVQDTQFPPHHQALVAESMAVNSTAHLERHPGQPGRPLGNPTEGALLLWLEDQGIDYLSGREAFEISDQLTFSTERKYMATLGNSPEFGLILHVKGAPEIVLSHCQQIETESSVTTLDESGRGHLEINLKHYETLGRRTLGFAYTTEVQNYQLGVELEKQTLNLIWLGFVAITDPVRAEVPQAIRQCSQAGIDIKMITGDSLLTAQEVGRQAGILTESDGQECYLTGQQLRTLDDLQATTALKTTKIIARARPQDKQRIVQLLQGAGEVVAVTGDGSNDAPALNQAQVGLSMGSGTFVAKEASDIILLDDSFQSVETAVMWGRSLYQNIQKFILFQLTINVAACGIALLGPFMGIDLPLTVIQLLWVNLIMDTFAALALATEPPNESVMELPPRDPEAFIISPTMTVSIFSVALIFLIFLVGFLFYIQQDQVVTPRELSLFFTTFVMLQFWNLFNAKCLGLKQSAFTNLFANPGFISIATVIFIGQIFMVQWGGNLFRTVPLSWQDWLVIIAGTSIVLWIGEIWRWVGRVE